MEAAVYDTAGRLIMLCRNVEQANNIVSAMGWRDTQTIHMRGDWNDRPA